MKTSSLDHDAYMAVMGKTRRRRKYFFGVLLAYIPALWLVHEISPTDRAMGRFFVVWVVVLIIVTALVAVSRCPRCGNHFHLQGMTFLVLRKCLHCQLPIKNNRN